MVTETEDLKQQGEELDVSIKCYFSVHMWRQILFYRQLLKIDMDCETRHECTNGMHLPYYF